MIERPSITRLADGSRLHFRHGPIDLVLQAFGARGSVRNAEQAAARRFSTVLEELCAELAFLHAPARPVGPSPSSATARRMLQAVRPLAAGRFITPMAAVAGAVADEILAAMTKAAPLEKAYVNNGGDIALHLSPAAAFTIGIADSVTSPRIPAMARVTGRSRVRGVATSGWAGRSFSLGIADAVTILADDAASADAAATAVANAVDLPGHPSIRRRRAEDLQPESDLCDIPVTVGVGRLEQREIEMALENGRRVAETLRSEGRIIAAALFLKGRFAAAGDMFAADPASASPAPHAAVLPSQRPVPRIARHA